MPMMGYDYSWGGLLLMLLSMVFWAAVFGLLLWGLLRWLAARPSSGSSLVAGPTGPSAMEILRQRYARGEIDIATFEQMREHLEGTTRAQEPAGVS